MPIKSYRDLVVWQKALDLATETYRLTEELPEPDRRLLSEHMREASDSIQALIIQGSQGASTEEYIQCIGKAHYSDMELQTLLYLCDRHSLAHHEQVQDLLNLSNEVGKMLMSLYRTLQKKIEPSE